MSNSQTQHQHHPVAQALAVLVGAATTAQSRVNGELASRLGSGLEAALVSFAAGLIILVVIAGLLRPVRRGLRLVALAVRDGRIRWWQTIGGTIGASFVAVQSFTVPLLGVAIFTISVVGAQTASSLLVDRLGVGPQGKLHLNRNRIAAGVIAVAAVGVAVSDRVQGSNFPLWAVAAAMFVGAAVSFQHAINGHVRIAAEHPVTAALMNFIWGTTALALAFAVSLSVGAVQWSPLPSGPWWLFTGGLFGLLFIVAAAQVIKPLGSLRFALGSVAGQLIGSLLFDIFAPTSGSDISAQLLTGIGMTAVAVLIANRKPAMVRQT